MIGEGDVLFARGAPHGVDELEKLAEGPTEKYAKEG